MTTAVLCAGSLEQGYAAPGGHYVCRVCGRKYRASELVEKRKATPDGLYSAVVWVVPEHPDGR